MNKSAGGKREEIRGVTSRDILNINNNFKWLWQYVFGNINFTDINSSVLNKLSGLQNSITGLTNVFNIHKNDSAIHVNSTDKNYWNSHVMDNSSHVTYIDKNYWNNHISNASIHVTNSDKDIWNNKANSTHTHSSNDITFNDNSTLSLVANFTIPNTGLSGEVIKIGSIINLIGTLKTNIDLSNEVLIATIPVNFRPLKNLIFNVRTNLGLAKLNIYSTGDIKIDLTSTPGYITSLSAGSEISLNGITFKGA